MVSISVMASEERRHFFPYLKEKLGDVPFSIDAPRKDPKNIGVWENCKRAWKMYAPEASHHIVIQDDALISKDFMKHVEDLLKKTPGDYAYSLYFGDELATAPQEKTKAENEGYIVRRLLGTGVATMLPTYAITRIMEWGDRNNTNIDDANIGYALQQMGMKIVYPVPCFVDHRSFKDTPTLVHSTESERTSKYFIDGKKRR